MIFRRNKYKSGYRRAGKRGVGRGISDEMVGKEGTNDPTGNNPRGTRQNIIRKVCACVGDLTGNTRRHALTWDVEGRLTTRASPSASTTEGSIKELAEAIQLCEIPSDRHRRIVENNRKEEFKHPKGQGEQSLLVIAIDSGRWEWFR